MNRDPQVVSMQRMSDCGVLRPKCVITTPPKAQDHCRSRLERLSQRQWMTISKLCSRYSGAAELHLWTHRDCDSMHKATHNFKLKSQHGDGGILLTSYGEMESLGLVFVFFVLFCKGEAPDWSNILTDGHKSKSNWAIRLLLLQLNSQRLVR